MNQINIDITVPGSKSITNRALLIAALAKGESVIRGACLNDDSAVFMDALHAMGIDISFAKRSEKDIYEHSSDCVHTERVKDILPGTAPEYIIIQGSGGDIPVKKCEVYVGSAGTAARFLTAVMALSDGCYRVTSSEQMKLRPMRELLEALEIMGAEFTYHEKEYCFPFTVRGRSYTGCGADKSTLDASEPAYEQMVSDPGKEMKVPLKIDKSSEFLSALLLCAPMVKEGFSIELTGHRTAKSYVDITMRMMSDFGIDTDKSLYRVPSNSSYTGREYDIEPDVSSACYFYACAVLNHGRALVRGVHMDSMQGDIRFIELLKEKGFPVTDTKEGVLLEAMSYDDSTADFIKDKSSATDIHIPLHGFSVDMSDFSDQSMTLACMAPLFISPTTITGIAHIRGQESDRIKAVVTEMNRIGVKATELDDGLIIYPIEDRVYKRLCSGSSKKVSIKTYNDHRIAMSFAILGTVLSGIVIDDPGCCSKTFPEFFDILNAI